MSKKGRKSPSFHPLTILCLLIVKGRWTEWQICEKGPFDSFHSLTPELGWCAADTRTFLKAEHLNGARKGLTTCTGGRLQPPRRNEDISFWSIGVIWAWCKMSFILNLNISKMSLSQQHNELPPKDYDNKNWWGGCCLGEDIAISYNYVSNLKLVVERLAMGCFNPTKY